MFEIVIYTEDSEEAGAAVVQAVTRRILLHLKQSHEIPHVDRARDAPARAANAHRWRERSARGEALRRALVQDLATRFAEGALVVFHYDGDVPWMGPGTRSVHDDAVAELMAEVERLMRTRMERPPPARPLPFVPRYSIEAWLYLNQRVVEELVRSNRAPQPTAAWIDTNRRTETGFDHVEKPKDACPLGDAFNQELAADFPVPRSAAASPSLRATIESWSAHPGLRDRLGVLG